ncbi:MAG: class I SAM-dependent methyltransferase [Gemmataceae bacterium]|nr:class I SAM-dependent methyltransferase [Gemmataceae bacterium]
MQLPPEAHAHYAGGVERDRLAAGVGALELARTQEVARRHLPPPPAVVLDVGGGPGVYAGWLAGLGYEVHLVDPVPLHVEQAAELSRRQPDRPIASVAVGDARRLDRPDASADAVLLLGPLYHLTDRADRLAALLEAGRVLRPGGVVLAAAISRFASALDGLRLGLLDDPAFRAIVDQDLTDGQHRNPTNHPHYFTTTYFHHPDELRAEVGEAGLRCEAVLGVEGPAWLLGDFDRQWADPGRREHLLHVVRRMEADPAVLGVSAHLLAVARRE